MSENTRPLRTAKINELRDLAATNPDDVRAELAYRRTPKAHALAAALGAKVRGTDGPRDPYKHLRAVKTAQADAPTDAPAPKRRGKRAKSGNASKAKKPRTPAQQAATKRMLAAAAAKREAQAGKPAHVEDRESSGGNVGDFADIAHGAPPASKIPTNTQSKLVAFLTGAFLAR